MIDEEISCDISNEFTRIPFIQSDMENCRELMTYKRLSKILRDDRYVSMVGHGSPKMKMGKNGLYVNCGTINAQRVCDAGCGVQFAHNFCGRYECPICWPLTVQRGALRISDRIGKILPYCKIKDLYHYSISWNPDLCQDEWHMLNRLLKHLKFFEAGITFRHFHRYNDIADRWEYSPHFHLICNCNFIDSKRLYRKYNVVIKRISHVTNLHSLVLYELGHSGIKLPEPKLENITFQDRMDMRLKRQIHYRYWGKFNYRKFHPIVQTKKVEHLCPDCGHTMSSKVIKIKKKNGVVINYQGTHAKFQSMKVAIAPSISIPCRHQVVRSRFEPMPPTLGQILSALLSILQEIFPSNIVKIGRLSDLTAQQRLISQILENSE